MRYAVNIEWDTDGEPVDLPNEVAIPDSVDDENIADFLSDEYEFCVFTCEVEEREE